MSDIIHVPAHKFRRTVPTAHRASLDTRLRWLWNQRFGTVQQVWQFSDDVLDKTAATLLFNAVVGEDLVCIEQIFDRLEGGSLLDTEVIERAEKEDMEGIVL